jgi:hypothetical protein
METDNNFQATWHMQMSFISDIPDIADCTNSFKHEYELWRNFK